MLDPYPFGPVRSRVSKTPSEAIVRSAVANDAPNIVQLLATWRVKTRKSQGVDAIELWMCVVYQNIPWGFAFATKDAGIPWQNTWHTHDSVSIGHALTRHQGVSWCRPHSTKRSLGKDGDFQWLSWGRVEYPTDTPANVGETINDNCAADLGRLNLRVFVGVFQISG